MKEERVFIDCGEIRLEGLLDDSPGDRALLMTHPHSLYGGEMHNNVVEAVVRAYREKNYATLRFNFRGVGASGGSFGEGIAEQEDVKAALEHLVSMGKAKIDLGGYSFGAWVCAHGLEGYPQVRRVLMVSPPVSAMDMSDVGHCDKFRLIIGGSRDDIGDISRIRDLIPRWNTGISLEIIEGADHFYGGMTGEIQRIVREFLEGEP
ncbi:MAG: alpha/beta fold hydrolase [Deltaproteobacteria bacterium]|nr:alpha/beta fold hydrolase [Deltaproteobacteria bacterium]